MTDSADRQATGMRDGVELVWVCGRPVLFALPSENKDAPAIMEINSTAAWYIEQMILAEDEDEIIKAAVQTFEISEVEAQSDYDVLLVSLRNEGYLK